MPNPAITTTIAVLDFSVWDIASHFLSKKESFSIKMKAELSEGQKKAIMATGVAAFAVFTLGIGLNLYLHRSKNKEISHLKSKHDAHEAAINRHAQQSEIHHNRAQHLENTITSLGRKVAESDARAERQAALFQVAMDVMQDKLETLTQEVTKLRAQVAESSIDVKTRLKAAKTPPSPSGLSDTLMDDDGDGNTIEHEL